MQKHNPPQTVVSPDRKQNSSLEEIKHANQEFRSAYQPQLMNVLFNHLVKFGNQLDHTAAKQRN